MRLDQKMHRAPSGRQIELRHGEQVVAITEVGAGLRSYLAGARPVIDGYPETRRCTGARGHSLIPWPFGPMRATPIWKSLPGTLCPSRTGGARAWESSP